MDIVLTIIQIAGSLGLFLFGMKLMSDGLQNSAGERMQTLLRYMTWNRFTALFTGLAVTSVIQSSSATTVFVISFVNAQLLSLQQAIGVIMGANIGTTVTAWIVSIFGFKFDIAKFAVPAIGIGLPFIFMKSKSRRDIGDTFIGFGLLFLGILYLGKSIPDINQHPDALRFVSNFSGHGFASHIFFVFVGTAVTVIIQSSSAAMAVTLTMANAGWIDFPTAGALCLGENIGTTITAQIAAFIQNRNAKRAAMAHTLFNVIGVIWVLLLFGYFLRFVDYLVPGDISSPHNIPNHLAMFHTAFNTLNCCLFIWFVPAYAKFIRIIFPEKEEERHETYALKYVAATLQDTPELNVLTVRNEIEKMSSVCIEMYDKTMCVRFAHNKPDETMIAAIRKNERFLDQMQEELIRYIAERIKENPSENSVENLSHMLRIVDELESIGDCCNNMTDIAEKSWEKKLYLSDEMRNDAAPFAAEVKRFLEFIKNNINKQISEKELSLAFTMETKINEFRHVLKKRARRRIQEGGTVKDEIIYIDTLEQLEHIGDYALNVAQELREMK